MDVGFESKFITVDGIRTHYLEAGSGPAVVLLHSGEFGACAELSWEHNIGALSRHFRVIAPDWLGFGQTDKLFDFRDMFQRRIDHMTRLVEALGIREAAFMGNSMAGGMLAWVLSQPSPPWPVTKAVLVSGGGYAPENQYRQVLNSYDGTKEHMQRMLQVLFFHPQWWDDPYLERRWRLSLEPGSWECTAAARFRMPGRSGGGRNRHAETRYEAIRVPTLIVAGRQDYLREPGWADQLAAQIPAGRVVWFEEARHCPHIDCAEAFNQTVLQFLLVA